MKDLDIKFNCQVKINGYGIGNRWNGSLDKKIIAGSMNLMPEKGQGKDSVIKSITIVFVSGGTSLPPELDAEGHYYRYLPFEMMDFCLEVAKHNAVVLIDSDQFQMYPDPYMVRSITAPN